MQGKDEPYIGIIAEKRHNNAQILACLFSDRLFLLETINLECCLLEKRAKKIWQQVQYLENEYKGVTGMKLIVVGQTEMLIKFKTIINN